MNFGRTEKFGSSQYVIFTQTVPTNQRQEQMQRTTVIGRLPKMLDADW